MSKPSPSGVARPPRRGGASLARMLVENLIYTGVKGVTPLGCLPHQGRMGVILANLKNLKRQIEFYPAATA